MKPIRFPEVTVVWAENQPEYLPLPAYTDEERTVTCWSLSWRERLQLLLTGRMWLSQLNFGGALQAQLPQVESPFEGVA